jgi:hypothetical protein
MERQRMERQRVERQRVERQRLEQRGVVRQRVERGGVGLMRGLPRSARMLLAGVVTVGAAAVAVRLPQVASWTGRDLIAFAALIAATIAGEQLHVAVRFGEQTKHVTITEASYAAALLLGVAPSVLTLAAGIGVVTVYSLRQVAAHKVAFNAGSYVAAVTAAELVFAAARPMGAAYAVIPAMLAFFVVNASTVVGVIALAEARSFASVFAPIARLEFGHTTLNLAAGMLLANVWLASPPMVVMMAIAPVAILAAYRRMQPQPIPALTRGA